MLDPELYEFGGPLTLSKADIRIEQAPASCLDVGDLSPPGGEHEAGAVLEPENLENAQDDGRESS
jgi:hypothetical protein